MTHRTEHTLKKKERLNAFKEHFKWGWTKALRCTRFTILWHHCCCCICLNKLNTWKQPRQPEAVVRQRAVTLDSPSPSSLIHFLSLTCKHSQPTMRRSKAALPACSRGPYTGYQVRLAPNPFLFHFLCVTCSHALLTTRHSIAATPTC